MTEPDPVTPLWRAAQVFRLLSCVYALGFQIAINEDLDHPALGWLLFAVLIAWSAACAVAYLQGFGRRIAWVVAEIVVVTALVLSTEFVASDQWALDNQSWPTTLWATNATISAAILMGPIPGMLTGVVVMVASTFVKGFINYDLGRNATIVIVLAVVLYLLPTLAGLIRGVDGLALVFLVNLIGGTALIGWPAAMILAFGPRQRRHDVGLIH